MALAETTLSAAVTVEDTSVTVASATSVAAGRLFQIDGELMEVSKSYSSGTAVPVLRGRFGTATAAHVTSARIVHGNPSDFAPAIGSAAPFSPGGRVRRVVSVSATGTLTLPNPGEDMLVILNGTGAITLTIPVPTKELDGTQLIILSNGVAAHIPTFTGGLSGAGSGYDAVTINASAVAGLVVYACNEVWIAPFAPAMGGTVTNLIGSVA